MLKFTVFSDFYSKSNIQLKGENAKHIFTAFGCVYLFFAAPPSLAYLGRLTKN